jgi:dipeptidyl aminopeptidase/acylaminoacyl peptidase
MRKIIFLALLISGSILAQNKVMTPELLWQLGRVSLEDVSADGSQFIYGVTYYDVDSNQSERQLYLMAAEGGEPQQLTAVDGSANGAQFLGTKIGFSFDGQYHLIDPSGENLQTITAIEGGLSGAKAYLQQDGSIRLLFSKKVQTQETPEEKYPNLPHANFKVIDQLMYRHWDSWNDYKSNHLCLATYQNKTVTNYRDLMEGKAYDVPVPPFGGSESYTLSPDGNLVAYEMKPLQGKAFAEQTNSEIYLHNLSSGTTELLSKGMMGYDKNPQFSPDGKHLAWLSMRTNGYESDVNDLIIYNLNTQEKMAVLATKGLYDELTFQSFAWAENDELYAGVPTGGSNQIYEVEFENFTGAEALEIERITKGDYNYNHFEIAGEDIIVSRQDMNHASEIYFVKEKNGKAKQLTHVNDSTYASIGKSKIEKRMVTTSDGKEMLTWVIYPPNFDPTKKYPTLLYCQGGPQSQVSQFYSFRWNFQLMAAQGYIVVAPNRRGLPGFGREWNEQISGDWGGQAMDDYLSAIDALATEPFVDQDNLGCVGASYGGYSVYMLAGIHEGRFKSFISHCGLFDLESWYLSTEEMFFANYDLGGPFWEPENRKTYQKFDPKDYVQNWDTPILVIHGAQDFRVPENQGIEAFNAAQLRGVPSRFLYFPQEGHWVLNPQNGLVWHSEFFGWLDQWLK